jgi:Tfp pilus assembly protein PilV
MIEVLVSMVIIAIGLLGLAGAQLQAQQEANQQLQEQQEARHQLQEANQKLQVASLREGHKLVARDTHARMLVDQQ